MPCPVTWPVGLDDIQFMRKCVTILKNRMTQLRCESAAIVVRLCSRSEWQTQDRSIPGVWFLVQVCDEPNH